MKFNDIPAKILSVRVKSTDSDQTKLEALPVLSVSTVPTRPGEFNLRLRNSLVSVKPLHDADIRLLENALAAGGAMLAQLADPAKDGSIGLQVAVFADQCRDMEVLEIGVDEYVEERYAKITGAKAGKELAGKKLFDALERDYCFKNHQDDAESFFFLLAGPVMDDILKPEPELEPDTSDDALKEKTALPEQPSVSPRVEATRLNSFGVTGNGLRFVATETKRPDGESIYVVTRLTKTKNQPDRALRLAKAKLKFVNWSEAEKIETFARAQMNSLIRDEGGYLKKWDEFGDLEGELLLKHAREIGALECDMEATRDGNVTVRIAKASESAFKTMKANGLNEVELVVGELPAYLTNPNLTFAEFSEMIAQEEELKDLRKKCDKGQRGKQNKKQRAKPDKERDKHHSRFEVVEYDADSQELTLKTENISSEKEKTSSSGTLILSLGGGTTQIMRQMNARKAILFGRSANPQLGPLIEEKGRIQSTKPPRQVEALSAFVRHKVFPLNPPTAKQKEAIEIALNTPDIALIQGPPGTGKTTVIVAIVERLNELADKRGETIKGKILLTGFQHAAVENMIGRIKINGVPTPKFGTSSGKGEEEFDAFEEELEKWCVGIAKKIRKKDSATITRTEHEREISDLCLKYLSAPTHAAASNLVSKIAALDVVVLNAGLRRRAENLSKKLSFQESLNDEFHPLRDSLRRLRTQAESFADDGPERVDDVLFCLENDPYDFEQSERDLLDKARHWRPGDDIPTFLNELAALKRKHLVRLTAPPFFRVEKMNDEVVSLAEEAVKRIRKAGFSAKDEKSAALAEFLADLENNPQGMRNAVADYSFAFSATCQQSVAGEIWNHKGIWGDEDDQKKEFDYVIVDEAARVSPRDLMIPMARGKRIILVGDHRQLPHIINEEVERQMELGESGKDEQEWIKKSMFEYLFTERLEALQEQDGIQRLVTLDKQYRMHPLLGDFISDNFYKPFAAKEEFSWGFEKGKDESKFSHQLPDVEGIPAVWLDVPVTNIDGPCKRPRNGSWERPAEAAAIARRLRKWMESDKWKDEQGKELSCGVISFYRPQADLIAKQLQQFTDAGNVSVNTVDSFQGMEFDVVFMSMVRTMSNDWKPTDEDKMIQARKQFGFLCLSNRLNVALSRQKKLLVVVGDSRSLQNDLAAEFIPGLVEFYKLCDEKGKVLPCR